MAKCNDTVFVIEDGEIEQCEICDLGEPHMTTTPSGVGPIWQRRGVTLGRYLGGGSQWVESRGFKCDSEAEAEVELDEIHAGEILECTEKNYFHTREEGR
jgi:hypothetical protein